jgi:hypothetical protein
VSVSVRVSRFTAARCSNEFIVLDIVFINAGSF